MLPREFPPMPISIRCPRGHKLNVPSKYAGQTVRCPACQSRIVVPGKLVAAQESTQRAAHQQEIEQQPAAQPSKPARREKVAVGSPDVLDTNSETSTILAVAPREAPLGASAATALAFTPGDPRSPVPEGGLVPGANLKPGRLVAFLRERKLLSAAFGYQADASRRRCVHWLAAAQVGLALFAAWPAVWRLFAAPSAPWVYVVLLLSLSQIAYAIWLSMTPDYSATQVAMFATGTFAAIYAAALAVCWLTAPRFGGWLELGALKLASGSKPT